MLKAITDGKASARLLQEARVANPLGNSGIPEVKEKIDDALDRRPNEGIKDAAEDIKDEAKDIGHDVKDAAKDIKDDVKDATR